MDLLSRPGFESFLTLIGVAISLAGIFATILLSGPIIEIIKKQSSPGEKIRDISKLLAIGCSIAIIFVFLAVVAIVILAFILVPKPNQAVASTQTVLLVLATDPAPRQFEIGVAVTGNPQLTDSMATTPFSSSTPSPTSALPTSTPTPTPLGPIIGEHVIKPGETIFCIARAYGVQPSAIVQTNGLLEPRSLRSGQVLIIPAVQWLMIPYGPVCPPQFLSPFPALPYATCTPTIDP